MSEERIKGHVTSSNHFGNYSYPGRTDYEAYFLQKDVIQTADELWKRDDLLANIQRHWHSRGQNGCVFAQAIATNAPERGWVATVVNNPIDEIETEPEVSNIDDCIQNAIANPAIQVQSLLFPQVIQPQELVRLTRAMATVPSVFIAKEVHYDEFSTIALRIAINDAGVLSWLMGFGPFNFLPIQ